MADGTVTASAVAPPDSAARRWRGMPVSPHVYGVGALTALIASVYSVLSLTLYYTYQDKIYDLAIFDQAIRSYAHFQPGISVAKGMHNFSNPDFSVLGDHFSPIDALLAPLYWICNSPVDLLLAQAVLFALAIPPLWVFTRRAFGGGRKGAAAAYFVAVAYGLSWPIAAAVGFGFHEVAFAPLLTALALERLQKGRLKTALVMLAGLVLIKEDMGLYVAGLGLGLALTRNLGIPRQRLAGLLIAVAAALFSLLAIFVFIPAMGGESSYYWGYRELGPNAPAAVKHVLEHPRSSLLWLFHPGVKLHTMLELFAPFLFLCFLSPYVLAVIPLLLERMLGVRYPAWWSNLYQYNAYLVVPIALGAVDGALRLERWLTWLGGHWRALRGLRWLRRQACTGCHERVRGLGAGTSAALRDRQDAPLVLLPADPGCGRGSGGGRPRAVRHPGRGRRQRRRISRRARHRGAVGQRQSRVPPTGRWYLYPCTSSGSAIWPTRCSGWTNCARTAT